MLLNLERRCANEEPSREHSNYDGGMGMHLTSQYLKIRGKTTEELYAHLQNQTPKLLQGSEYALALYNLLDKIEKYRAEGRKYLERKVKE